MADGPDVSEILRRTVQANARLYKGWVDLSLEYWRGVGEIFGVAPPPGLDDAATAEDSDGPGIVILEAEAGATARGAFLVTNDLGRTVRCDLVASDMRGPQGVDSGTNVTFDPPTLELAPGEQRVVTATADVHERLAVGAAYTGTVSIKGMDGFSVPFVLRRTHSLADAQRAAKGAGSADVGAEPSAGASAGGSADTPMSNKPGRTAGKRAAAKGKGGAAPTGQRSAGPKGEGNATTKGEGRAQAGNTARRRGKAKE